MYAACQSKGGFDSQQIPANGGALGLPGSNFNNLGALSPAGVPTTTPGTKGVLLAGGGVGEDKINLDAPDLLLLEDDEERKSDEDDTRRFTIKDFKEKAQKFVKDNFDKYAAKKKPKAKNAAANAGA